MSEIIRWSAVETADAIRHKTVSVREVVDAHLQVAHDINPKINALTDIIDDAQNQADELDNQHPGDDAPCLWGVPVTTKANVDQVGYANTNGITAFKDNIGRNDAAVVKNLKDAGAVVIGRTNTPEFSMRWCTSNPLHGVTLNPWDSAVTPGGSSGGGSAAVACGIGSIAHGSDLGGSLRYPAYCCGIATIRPSMGRIPAFNPDAVVERPPVTQTMAVHGPMARSVGDVRLGLHAMSSRSAQDPIWQSAKTSGRQRSDDITIGYCINPFADASVHDDVKQAMVTAVEAYRAIGINMIEMPFPGADRIAQLWGELLMAETVVMVQDAIQAHGSDDMNRLFKGYMDYYGVADLAGFIAGLSERITLQRGASELFDAVDLFMMPTSLLPPFENDLDFKAPHRLPEIITAQKPLHLVNLLALPSVALPTGVKNGLPTGVQLIGPMHDDDFVLDVAERLENQIGTIISQLPLLL